jgi:excisionase family DNA binding protein
MKTDNNVQTASSSDNLNQHLFQQNLIWMDSIEASTYLRISIGSLRNMVSLGQIKSYKLGRRLRFKRAELDKTMELSNARDLS